MATNSELIDKESSVLGIQVRFLLRVLMISIMLKANDNGGVYLVRRTENVAIVAAFHCSAPDRPVFQEWHRNGFGTTSIVIFPKYAVLCRILICFFHLGIIICKISPH